MQRNLTSFLHNKRPHISPAQGSSHLAPQPLQQVLGSILQMEGSLILHTVPEP